MYKIRKVKFIDHPILHDLDLDFCTPDGKAVETVIFAGENGTGKSAILNYIYGLFSGSVLSEAEVELENQNTVMTLHFAYDKERKRIWVRDNNGMNTLPGHDDFRKKYPLSGIYSDVDINFRAQSVSTVTSLNLDESKDSRRSSTELPQQIKQLLIDVQALDDAELAREMRSAPNMTKAQLAVSERMPRFTNAFAHMFDGLTYDRIDNENGHKRIYFKKFGMLIYCMTERFDNHSLWENYAENYTGFCIEYNFSDFNKAPFYVYRNLLYLMPMTYRVHTPYFDLVPFLDKAAREHILKESVPENPEMQADLNMQLYYKNKDYDFEHEWRFAIKNKGNNSQFFPFVNAVYAGKDITQEHFDQLIRITKTMNIPLYKQKINRANNGFDYEPIKEAE